MVRAVSDDRIQRTYRARIALFLFCGLVVVLLLAAIGESVAALGALEQVERARDRWQQPLAVVQALDLKSGDVAADLGCGSGYFALKLSQAVGGRGKVIAIDIRRLPLFVVRVRALVGGLGNIEVRRGRPDNPLLDSESADAVLIANTYHELADPNATLEEVKRALRRGGRLVVVDRGPPAATASSRRTETQHHEIAASQARAEILRSGFELVMGQDHFIRPPGDEEWWLVVARKP